MDKIGILIKRQEGAALIVALGAISVMIIIGVTVSALTMSNQKTVSHDKQQTAGQNIAEAGIDDAIAVTEANFDSVYPNGVVPVSAGDGDLFFDAQPLTDSQGIQIGTYKVWTKRDPERPDNVLITSKGTPAGATTPTETVRVSVKYKPRIFDYTFFVGDPENANSEMKFWRNSNHGCDWTDDYWLLHMGDDFDGFHLFGDHEWYEDCGTITIVGKTHVNGNLVIEGDTDYGSGHIVLLSRPGFPDTVTYTNNYEIHYGDATSGNIAPERSDPVDFPDVDYTADLATDDNSGTVILPFNLLGKPAGWSRSFSTFSISAMDFESRYKDKVVKIKNSNIGTRIVINGSSSSSTTITSTIDVLSVGSGLSSIFVEELKINGPGVTMQPANGLAILSARGSVVLNNGVNVGSVGNGALIFCSGTGGLSEFKVKGGGTLYGSVVVKGQQGELTTGNDDYTIQDTIMIYDDNYVSKLPTGWWQYGSMKSFKENYSRD